MEVETHSAVPGGQAACWSGMERRDLGSGVECLRVEAPKVIPRKGISRNEKFMSKECVKSTALIM